MDLTNLSDDELFGKVGALAETERFCLADFLQHLAELDRRPACEKKGYASTFAYLTRKLGFAEVEAMRRVRTARAARRFRSIYTMLARGDLNLVSVSMLEPFLTPENHESLLRRACRRSVREVERMVADMSLPQREPKDRIRALPAPEPPAEPAASAQSEIPLDEVSTAAPASVPVRVLFSFAADEEVRCRFKQAQDLLRHKFPEGRMEQIIGEALRRLVDEEIPRARRRRSAEPPIEKNRRIPLQVQ